MKHPPNNIKELRESRGLSQEQLADKVNTSRGQIYQLENGIRRLSHGWMVRLGKALNCAPEDFVTLTHEPSPAQNDIAHKRLKAALELWFKDEDIIAIHATILEAYREIRPNADMTKVAKLDQRITEGMILSCIMGLQAAGKQLNEVEVSFLILQSLNDPKLFKQEFWEFCTDFAGINNIDNGGKINKREFLQLIINKGKANKG